MTDPTGPILEFVAAELGYGSRTLWSGLDLRVEPGEFIAVLGGNGSGKTSLLRCALGLSRPRNGQVLVAGRPARRGNPLIGYIPQQRRVDPLAPVRAKDLVRLGLDGHRFGFSRADRRAAGLVDDALEAAGAVPFADAPIGVLSGGEQQRVRVAQAIVGRPHLLLCDEPLLSLDPGSQQSITELIDRQRTEHDAAVLFVTHEINPVLPHVDRVLYLAAGRFRIGTVDDVLTSEVLSELYGTPIEVIRSKGRVLVAGAPDDAHHHDHHHDPIVEGDR